MYEFIIRLVRTDVLTTENIEDFFRGTFMDGIGQVIIRLNRAGILTVENLLTAVQQIESYERVFIDSVLGFDESGVLTQEIYNALVLHAQNAEGISRDWGEGRFIVDSSLLHQNHLDYLLNYSREIKANRDRMPQIHYQNSEGIDAGGLTRDFLTRLFTAITNTGQLVTSPDLEKGTVRFRMLEEAEGITKEKLKDAFNAIGTLFSHALHGKSFTIGTRFSESVFEVMPALLKCDESPSMPSDLLQPQYREALIIYLQKEYSQHFNENCSAAEFVDGSKMPEGFDEDLKKDLLDDVTNELFATSLVTRGMKDQLRSLGMSIDEIKALTAKELSDRIQGTLSHDQVLSALNFDGASSDLKDNMEAWIRGLSSDELKKFIWGMTGSEALHSDTRLDIKVDANLDKASLPTYHTCFKSVDIPAYSTKEDLAAKLEASLAHLNPEEGFQLL